MLIVNLSRLPCLIMSIITIREGLTMYELIRALQSTLLSILGLYSAEFIGLFASLLCFILAGAYAFLAIKGASYE
jgi:hypothetical protein